MAGRRPIGEQAMSGAERQRRYRERLRTEQPEKRIEPEAEVEVEIPLLEASSTSLRPRPTIWAFQSTTSRAATSANISNAIGAESHKLLPYGSRARLGSPSQVLADLNKTDSSSLG